MKTKIGIGHSNQTDSYLAGREAASRAIKQGNIDRADFALIFCGGKHNPHQFLNGVNEVIPHCKKAGGTSFGVIGEEFIGYDGFEVGVTVFSSDKIQFTVFSQGELDLDEARAGEELGRKIHQAHIPDPRGLMVFFDSSKQQNPPMLNFATPLFASLEPYLPAGISCVGGGFLADMMLSECYQIVNNQVFTQHVIAILISGDCVIESTILHGCFPCSDYLTITKSEGPVVLEIDGMPAIQKIQELLGGPDVIDVKDFAMNVTLGVNRGEKFGDFKENEFANRLTLAVDEELKALIMFEPDLVVGTEVQLMRRNLESDYVGKAIEEKMRKIGHLQPIFSFYINCGGRARPFAGVDFEDAEVVRQALGTTPFSGFYSGVEVAHVGGVLQPLDWTGVLCFLAEK